MARVQLALNVSNLDAAIEFYSKLFDTEPAKRRPGYANFAIAHPPLKLVLIENTEAPGTLNHLGIEVESTQEVKTAADRLQHLGLVPGPDHQVTCCYALQEKVWVNDPDSAPWEIYTVLADVPTATTVATPGTPGSNIPAAIFQFPDRVTAEAASANCTC